MKKLLLPFLLFSIAAHSQKAVDSMIAAEKAFAAYAVEHSTKDAFLAFMDTSAIIFEKGLPVKGWQSWSKRQKRAGVLNWRPQIVEIAASGDWGYSTGPWTFQPAMVNDSVVAKGHFFTIWQRKPGKDWKFIVDVGTEDAPANNVTQVTEQRVLRSAGSLKGLEITNDAFIRTAATNTLAAHRQHLATKTVLNRKGGAYALKPSTQEQFLKSLPATMVYEHGGLSIAPSGDLAYSYGKILVDGKTENYLHIWRHEIRGWKLALEMLSF